jgi:alkyldihydroxyacetonephosphate synthase
VTGEALRGLPPDIVVADEPFDGSDWWALALLRRRRGLPPPEALGVVRPRTTEEVATVLRWASGRGVGVVPRGGGSGVCGGAQPEAGALVMDLTAMDRVVSVDPKSLVVTAEAGVSGPHLERALRDEGMTLAHVPESFHLSTLGGWIATKATGQLSTRYGGIEERILGLSAVLSDGTVVSSKPVPRSSAGPDWWRSFLGSEGTLGVVTEATLSAFPLPETASWEGASFGSFSAGLDALRRLVQAGIRPAVARLYDEMDAMVAFGSLGLSGPVTILRFEGGHRMVAAEVESAREVLASCGARVLGSQAGEHWWERRFDGVGAYRTILEGKGVLGPFGVVDTMEVAALWRRLDSLYEGVQGALRSHCDAVLAHSSHLYGSGANLYFTLGFSPASEEEAERRYLAAWEAAMRATLAAGGTISHHHGVGLLKAPWMPEESGSGMEALRRLKTALDPAGIMNPGKLGL